MTESTEPRTEPLTKAQIIERDQPLVWGHPLRNWLRHGDNCPSRRMTADMTAVDGPCSCGLIAALSDDEDRPEGPDRLLSDGETLSEDSIRAIAVTPDAASRTIIRA